MNKLLYCSFLAFLNISLGQKKIDPLPEHTELAKDLKTQYVDHDIVLLNSKDYITFAYHKKK